MTEIHSLSAAADYKLAWTIYLVAAVVWLLLQGWLTRHWQRETSLLLLGLVAIVLLMPEPVPGYDLKAPALGFLLLAPLTGQLELLAPVLVKLSLAGIGLVLLVVGEGIWRVRRQHRRQAQTAERVERHRQRERMGV